MAAFNRILFSTGKDDWETPQDLFDRLDDEFHFELDVAATRTNAKCRNYYGPDHPSIHSRDGLTAPWSGPCWCNPPYSRGLQKPLIAKAAAERRRGVLTVLLLPSRTDTEAFHAYVYDQTIWQPRPGVEIRLLAGRLKFSDAKNGATFASMVVIFRPTPMVARTSERELPDLAPRFPTMADSDVDEGFVMLKHGLVIPAPAYCLLLDLERRHFTISRDGDTLVITPPERLTREDCASIRRWKWHLLMLLNYTTRVDLDAHLFTDVTMTTRAS